MSKRKRQSKGPYVAVPKAILNAPAWRAMCPGARLLWIELRGRLRNDGSNNGKVFRTCRDAAKAIGTRSTRSIVRWYAENEHYGFLVKTAHGFLGSDGHGIGDHYRFTDLAHGTHAATRDYEKWDGKKFVYARRRGSRKKQNPVSLGDTRRVPRGHILGAGDGGSVCVPQGHIGEAPACVPRGHVSSLPLPVAGEERKQGSSTARAPASAGGAGSSPAPVAKPDLTTMVLQIVNEQLDELDARRGALSPKPLLPWSTPTLVEVTDPEELIAIRRSVGAAENGGRLPALWQGLTSRRRRDLHERRSDRAYRHYSPNDLAAGKHDDELRAILHEEVPPEFVEIEFERV